MTMKQAAKLAAKLWDGPDSVGIIKRGSKVGYLVGRAFTDGRKAEILGQSACDWESAFINAGWNGNL
jgi:succinyl-CoA synthetase alpha subunit